MLATDVDREGKWGRRDLTRDDMRLLLKVVVVVVVTVEMKK